MFYKADLFYIFQNTLKGQKELPSWLTRARSQLLPKNENTNSKKLPSNSMPKTNVQALHQLY